MAWVYCNQCGHRNPAGSNFCSSCGAPVEQREDDVTVTLAPVEGEPSTDTEVAAPDDIPAGAAALVVKRGPNAGSRYLLAEGVVHAGRHPDSDIFLDDITVSRRHAEVERGDEGWVVRDVGSLNGTYLNRERIEEAPLHHGDELQIGKFRLVFFSGQVTRAGA